MNNQAIVTPRLEIDLDAWKRYYGTTETRQEIRAHILWSANLALSDAHQQLIDAGVLRVTS
jgi:hypothetical protein